MARQRTTGPPTEYTPDEERSLAQIIDQAFREYSGGGLPTRIRITAQIEWAGVVDHNARDGIRSTTLDRLNLAGVRAVLDPYRATSQRAWLAREQAAQAQPLRSYRAKGWHAQLSQLLGTRKGRDAGDRAGLNPTRRTLLGWLSNERTPTRANRQRIAAAYAEIRDAPVRAAQATHRAAADAHTVAAHVVVETFNAALLQRYDAEIRLRMIEQFDLLTWRLGTR